MVLKPSNTYFAMQELQVVGPIVSQRGICVNPDRINGILDMEPPLSKTQVRRFLGMASQFRGQIRSYASLSADLNALVKKTHTANWCEDQLPVGAVSSFNALKSALTKAPILGVPIPNYPHINCEWIHPRQEEVVRGGLCF